MPQDEILGSLCELEDSLRARVELQSELLSCNVVRMLHIEILVEQELVTIRATYSIVKWSSALVHVLSSWRVFRIEVSPKRVFLPYGVVVPHASVDSDDRLPRLFLGCLGHLSLKRGVVGCCAQASFSHYWEVTAWPIAAKGSSLSVPIRELPFLLLSDQGTPERSFQ